MPSGIYTRTKKPRVICSLKGCTQIHTAIGYCFNHYQQARYKGEILAEGRQCEISKCSSLRYGKKYCEKHYKQMKKFGRLLTPEDKTLQGKLARSKSAGSTDKHWTLADSSKRYGFVPKTAFKKGHNLSPKIWKGNNKDYVSLHTWVNKELGQPDTCINCKRAGLSGHLIHWANKSQEYKRDLDDWLRLCAKCHQAYDRNRLTLKQIGV